MPRYSVDWNRGDWHALRTRGPRVSSFWVCDDHVVAATPCLELLVGLSREEALEHLRRRYIHPSYHRGECVPPTVAYHKKLLAAVNAVVGLTDSLKTRTSTKEWPHMLIELDSNTRIAADSIEGISCNNERNTVTVTMKSGERHTIGSDYRKSVWETMDRIMLAVDKALAQRDGFLMHDHPKT